MRPVQDHRPDGRIHAQWRRVCQYVKAMPWVAERGIVALPDEVSFEEATFIEPINTIVKAVEKARITAGETVLVIGCGPIGLQLLMVAKLTGAKLYTSDPMAQRRAKSLTLGALESFDPSSGKLTGELKARTNGRGPTLCWLPWRIQQWCKRLCRLRGPVDAFSCLRPTIRSPRSSFQRRPWASMKKRFWVAIVPRWTSKSQQPTLVLSRRLPVMDIVTHRFPLDRIQEALELAANPTTDSLKILITHA